MPEALNKDYEPRSEDCGLYFLLGELSFIFLFELSITCSNFTFRFYCFYSVPYNLLMKVLFNFDPFVYALSPSEFMYYSVYFLLLIGVFVKVGIDEAGLKLVILLTICGEFCMFILGDYNLINVWGETGLLCWVTVLIDEGNCELFGLLPFIILFFKFIGVT